MAIFLDCSLSNMQDLTTQKKRHISLKNACFAGVFVLALLATAWFRYHSWGQYGGPVLLLPSLPDEIQEISPEGNMILEFSQRMNTSSVEDKITILPDMPTQMTWDGRRLFLKPSKALKQGDQVTISLKEGMKSWLGKPSEKSYVISYEVGPAPELIDIFPEGDVLGGRDRISLLFTHAMVTGDQVDLALREAPLDISPPVDGDWRWLNTKTLSFLPSEEWPLSNRIEISNKEPLSTADQTVLQQNVSISYETPRIEQLPEEEQKEKHLVTEPFAISFTQPAQLNSLKDHVQLRDESGKALEFISIVPGEKEGYYLVKNQLGNWKYGESYSMLIGEELLPITGNLKLGKELQLNFNTEVLVELSNAVALEDGAFELKPGETEMKLTFKEEVLEEKLNAAIKLVPDYPFALIRKSAKEYLVRTDIFSQKRENIKIYISNLSHTNKTWISKAVELNIKQAGKFEIRAEQYPDKICIHSSSPLQETSYVKSALEEYPGKWGWKYWAEGCEDSPGFISYQIIKENLPPGNEVQVEVFAQDIWDRSQEISFSFSTLPEQERARKLKRSEGEFYLYESQAQDLQFEYESTNIGAITVQACKLSPEKAVEIESQYEKRWRSFFPNDEDCERYKAVANTFKVLWGENQQHVQALLDIFPEAEKGLYFFKAYAPGVKNEEGEALEINQVIHYTDLQVISKRGESALLWVTQNQQALENAVVHFLSSEGSILSSDRSNSDGLVSLEENRLKYEFTIIKTQDQQILLSTFRQTGYEPERYGSQVNIHESPYQYAFLLEKDSLLKNAITGVFTLKAFENGSPIAPKAKQGVLTLSNQKEEVLWRSFEDIDKWGNLPIHIQPQVPLLEDSYQLSVCLGLHDGVCHGENLWTTVYRQDINRTDFVRESAGVLTDQRQLFELENSDQVLTIQLLGEDENSLTLITVEKDHIIDQRVVRGTGSKIQFEISDLWYPEVLVTASTLSNGDLEYWAEVWRADEDMMKMTLEKPQADKELPRFSSGQNDQEKSYSLIIFEADAVDQDRVFEELSQLWHPRRGTKIITAGNTTPLGVRKYSYESLQLSSEPMSILEIPGVYIDSFEIPMHADDHVLEKLNDQQSHLFIAHNESASLGVATVQQEDEETNYSISIEGPDYLRPTDQVVYAVEISNDTSSTQNVSLRTTSEGLINYGESVFHAGLPSQASRSLRLPFGSPSETLEQQVIIHSELQFSDIYDPIRTSKDIEIIKNMNPVSSRSAFMKETNEKQSSILIPISPGQYVRKVIASRSPTAFVLENLKAQLRRESIGSEDALYQTVLAAQFSSFLSEKEDLHLDSEELQREIFYLKILQQSDGGWSQNAAELISDPLKTARMVKALSSLEELGYEIPEEMKNGYKGFLKDQLDAMVNERIRTEKKIYQIEPQKMVHELLILNALSSVSPNGVNYANNWYTAYSDLPNAAVLLLLITLEDFRDAGVSGMQYKIEELIQELKARRSKVNRINWIENDLPGDSHLSSFVLTSWYLEALVRQASSHSDIPSVITWLVQKKYLQEFQSSYQQFVFLRSMSSYLQIFTPSEVATELTVDLGDGNQNLLSFADTTASEAYAFTEVLTVIEENKFFPEISYAFDTAQAFFVEVSWQPLQSVSPLQSNELTVYQKWPTQRSWELDDELTVDLVILTAHDLENVLVIIPKVSLAEYHIDPTGDFPLALHRTPNQADHWMVIPVLEKGETTLRVDIQFTSSGKVETAPVIIYEEANPQRFATSNTIQVEVR